MSDAPTALLDVDVVAQDHTVWSGSATSVVAVAYDGSIGILPGHSPVLALLAAGLLRVRAEDGSEWQADLSGGFMSGGDDRVTIVVDSASDVLSH